MDEKLRELYNRIDAIRHDAFLLHSRTQVGPVSDALAVVRESMRTAQYALAPMALGMPPAKQPTITERLEEAIALRPLTGDPLDGPYPASVEDVAAEIHTFLLHLETESATGLLDALLPGLLSLQRERRWEATRAALAPLLDELTASYLTPRLRGAGIEDPEQYRLDYDLTPLKVRPEADPFGDEK